MVHCPYYKGVRAGLGNPGQTYMTTNLGVTLTWGLGERLDVRQLNWLESHCAEA